MKLEEKKALIPESQNKVQKLEEIQFLQELFKRTADEDAISKHERKKAQEREKFELISGRVTSISEERERIKILSEVPQEYEPKFSPFFHALGKLIGWSEETIKAYHKPHIAALTINEVIYYRFSTDVIHHIQSKNPYIKYCLRKYKNYYFLGEDGILLLEQYIDEAVTLMNKCSSMYEFRLQHATNYGTPFQPDLFR